MRRRSMPGRRPKKTGYSVMTMRRRLGEMCDELLLMADDERLSEDVAHKARIRLLQAQLILEKDYYHRR
jgi:hypothetical protein